MSRRDRDIYFCSKRLGIKFTFLGVHALFSNWISLRLLRDVQSQSFEHHLVVMRYAGRLARIMEVILLPIVGFYPFQALRSTRGDIQGGYYQWRLFTL